MLGKIHQTHEVKDHIVPAMYETRGKNKEQNKTEITVSTEMLCVLLRGEGDREMKGEGRAGRAQR